jgi:L-seryl-tRNA(Ser) seleniumtransferase
VLKNEILRQLPSVDEVLEQPTVKLLINSYPRQLVVDGIRSIIDNYRQHLLSIPEEKLSNISVSISQILPQIEEWLAQHYAPSLKRVINATGIVIHTNLGRSILSEEARKALNEAASFYTNLEFNLEKGIRGSRHMHVEELLVRITAAEAALVVNNNAAAVLLALSALAKGKETIVSRGQLVEIGGSFRIPDIMRQSGSTLVEVGTTNKTYISDYRAAVNENTALLLKVHPSNFRMVGFTQEVSLEELVELGCELGLPVMEDLGSGVLVDLTEYGIAYEPTVQQSIKAGADVVTFSGDKLLGGPQAGIIVGRRRYIEVMKKHPLARALRIDKLSLAALSATLRSYLDLNRAIKENPTLYMITKPIKELKREATKIARKLAEFKKQLEVSVEREVSRAGGGSLPLADLPTYVVSIKPKALSINKLETSLRSYNPPIIVRIKEDKILIDPRTLQKGEEKIIYQAFKMLIS